MTELIKKINERIDKLQSCEVPYEYKKAIEIFKIQSCKSFRKVEVDFLPIYTLLLIINEVTKMIKEENKKEETKKEETNAKEKNTNSYVLVVFEKYLAILGLIDHIHDLFTRKAFDTSFYEEYFTDIELAYKKDKKFTDMNFICGDNKELIKRLNDKNRELNEMVFYDCQAYEPTNAILSLFKLCPKKEIYLEFLKFHEIDHIYHSISACPATAIMLEFVSEKKLDKIMDDFINQEASDLVEGIHKYYKEINEFDKNLTNDTKKYNKEIKKVINNYKKLMGNISYQQSHYISNSDFNSSLKLIEEEDLEILELYLKFVIKNNQMYDEKIEKENKRLKTNQISSLEILFNKYNFSFSRLDRNTQINISKIDDIESRLNVIDMAKMSLNDYSSLSVYNILCLPIENINFILGLYTREIIDDVFIEENIELLSDKDLFNNFKNNIDLLNNIDIDKIARYNPNIFLIDNQKIIKRYKLFVEDYKIPTEKIYNFEFLTDDRVFDLIDSFIELGYIEQIRNNPNYLTVKNEIMIKRLYVSSLIDLKVINEDNSFIGSVVSGKDFYVSDNRLDEFILDEKDNYIDSSSLDKLERLEINPNRLLTELKAYEVDDDYQINGVLLSKKRILRNIESFLKADCKDALFNAIMYKATNLTSDTIEVISKICSHKVKAK